MQSELGLGDLVRSWNAMQRDPGAIAALARVLGLARQAPLSVLETHESETGGPSLNSQIEPRKQSRLVTKPEVKTSSDKPVTLETTLTLHSLPPGPAPQAPAWLQASTLPRAAAPKIKAAASPLFVPPRERTLLAAIARRLRPDGELDIPAVVDSLVRLRLPRVLPRRQILSLRGGVQLILDQSAWMAPFTDDVAQLTTSFRAVVGDACEELWMWELPPALAAPTEDTPRAWTAPRPGTAVIIVSDLGRTACRLGNRSAFVAWRAFLASVQAAGFEPVVLVPGRTTSYFELGGVLRNTLLLGWDRSARLAEVAQFRKGRSR